MSSSIDLYRKEIFNFLRTVTIKFEPFAYAMGRAYMDKYGIANPHGAWNPYYIHLAGEYTAEELANNDVIYVYTIEREEPERIILTKDIVNTNPKTAKLYRLPNDEYLHLEEQYPHYRGLLRCIVYPIKSMEEAITAPNLTLLGYDASLLEINERESIIKCIKDFLDMVRTRWWIEEYTYEDMYATTFWAMMWQMLPAVLLNQRFMNIKTPYVHSFHVWEYLKSKGLGDYRDVLTLDQSLWLYRNIDYILKNKGKVSNLGILAENLLGDACVSLRKINMLQSTTGFIDTLHTVPQFLFYNYFTDVEEKTSQYDDLNPKLYSMGLNNKDSVDYVNQTTTELGSIRYNNLLTKYLELKKETIDTSAESMMTTFLLHTLIYRCSLNKLEYSLGIVDIHTGNKVKLYINDMICLMYYAACRSAGWSPICIPDSARVRVPYTAVAPSEITESIKYGDNTYRIKELVAVDQVLSLFEYPTRPFTTRDDFAEFANHQYSLYYLFYKQMESSNKYLYHKAFRRLLDDLTVNRMVQLHLTQYSYFEDWINSIDEIHNLIKSYEAIEDEKLKSKTYANLALLCYDTVFNIEDSETGINTIRKMDSIYDAIRNLFISLCSYNITFIDSERDLFNYLHIEEPDVLFGLRSLESGVRQGSFFNLLIDVIEYITRDRWKVYKLRECMHDIEVLFSTEQYMSAINLFIKIIHDINCEFIYKIKTQLNKTVSHELSSVDNKVVHRFTLHAGIGNTGINMIEE